MGRNVHVFISLTAVLLLNYVQDVHSCSCVPKKQMYAFSSIRSADVFCRVKYAYQYLGKRALFALRITPDEYDTVYQGDSDEILISDTCKHTLQGDSFSMAWYCAEYCVKFCPRAFSVSCGYKQNGQSCKTTMHCQCVNYEGHTCDHEIQPSMLQEKFNKTCLNCYWAAKGDDSRKCLSTFGEVLRDSSKCNVKPINPNSNNTAPKTMKPDIDYDDAASDAATTVVAKRQLNNKFYPKI